MKDQLISFVIPCYCSEQTIRGVVDEIKERMQVYGRFEIILVNDCSRDHTYQVIRELVKEHEYIKGINLARNFGQASATMAGLKLAEGDIIVSLDDDGQSPLDGLPLLLEKIAEGYDIVYGDYYEKKESPFRLFGSKVNELMQRALLGKPKEIAVNSFFACTRMVVDEVVKYQGAYPYIPGLMLRTTKKIANVKVEHREREYGTSTYTFGKLLTMWLNGFTAFSIKPLRVAAIAGVLFALLGFGFLIFIVIRKLVDPNVQMGWTSIISLMTGFDGLILIVLGLIGEYVGRIYLSINSTPQYIVREIITHEDQEA